MSMQINLQHMCSKWPPPECTHASERLLRTRPMFMVSVGVSILGCRVVFCRARGENKQCLLPQRAADAEVIASHWAYQHIREWVRVSAGQSSSTPCSWDYKIELLRRETRCTLFHRNSGHRTVQIVSRWITKSGLQRGSASSRQRFEMLTNCDSVCWTFGSALNKTSSTHPLTSGVCDSKHACVLNKIAVNLSA